MVSPRLKTSAPASATSHSMGTPAASMTRRAAVVISGPTPSPGMSVTRWRHGAACWSGPPGSCGSGSSRKATTRPASVSSATDRICAARNAALAAQADADGRDRHAAGHLHGGEQRIQAVRDAARAWARR